MSMAGQVSETETLLARSGQVILDSSGNGTLIFDPASARTRWVVKSVVVSTNQAANATVIPVATVARNTVQAAVLSQGNNQGQSWSGNQDTFAGSIDIGPCDFLSVLFSPPPGATGAQIALLSGVTGFATVTGTAYTRRA